MSQAQEYPYLKEEEISRKAIEKEKSSDFNESGQLNAFLTYGEELIDFIEEYQGPHIKNEDIREHLEPRKNKGDVGRMMNFLKEYDVGETWTDNPNKTIWIKSEFEIDKIRKIYGVLEGYCFND